MTLNEDGNITSNNIYEPFGKQIPLMEGEPSRLSFISKEKDIESSLGDFGVRKYNEEIGRFTSIDPLWELQYSWSPYHYSYNNPLRYIDANGNLPGDVFESPEQAAHDFGKNYNTLSIKNDKEIATTIYKTTASDGTIKYSYHIPRMFSQTNSGYSLFENDVASVHTHGSFTKGYDNNNFSEQDKTNSKKDSQNSGRNIPIFVVTPNGSLQKYDPAKAETKVITKDMPRDPKDPEAKNNKTPVFINDDTRNIPIYMDPKAVGYGEVKR